MTCQIFMLISRRLPSLFAARPIFLNSGRGICSSLPLQMQKSNVQSLPAEGSSRQFLPFLEFFKKFIPLDLAPAKRPVLFLQNSVTLDEAIQRLSGYHVLSAPVLDHNNACIGMIDMNDILAYLFQNVPADKQKRSTAYERMVFMSAIKSTTVSQLVNFSRKDPLIPVYETDRLDTIMKMFADGLHRVVIYNHKNEIVRILTQSDVIRFLHQHLKEPSLQSALSMPLLSLPGKPYPRFSLSKVSTKATVYDCIQRLNLEGGGALPIVEDATGRLRANFSPFDLRGLYEEKFPHFDQTVINFLQIHSPASTWPIKLPEDATVSQIIESMIRNRVHHVYTVDSHTRPSSLIAMTDLCHFFAKHSLPNVYPPTGCNSAAPATTSSGVNKDSMCDEHTHI